ncbi:MAG TPA: septum formation initiator family protein [Gaiellaceae bacterium]|nr:septum formation initiator family protein [Gaiellaceae bacterium]
MARRRRSISRVRLRRALLVGGLVLVGFLYYHPLRTYLDTKRQVTARQAEVRDLRAEKAKLERQLKRAATPAALARQARMQLSLVKPGEQLYIVKGIDAWRKRQR